VVALAVFGSTFRCSAADNKTGTVDPTGTWRLTTAGPKTQTGAERTLRLKLVDGKLSGTMSRTNTINGVMRGKDFPIEETVVKGDELSFLVSTTPGVGSGANALTKYEGKISGDTIKGKLEAEWMGNKIEREREAKRVRE
jgi:hypothetical protein